VICVAAAHPRFEWCEKPRPLLQVSKVDDSVGPEVAEAAKAMSNGEVRRCPSSLV
jgi:hypothetical protein